MEVKQTKNIDVYAKSPLNYDALHRNFEMKLGKDHPFAKHNAGYGFHSWTDSRHAWLPVSEAGPVVAAEAMQALEIARRKVADIFGQANADLFFTYPDDSYIFYSKDDGMMHVLIAGWGFTMPRHRRSGPEVVDVPGSDMVDVELAFIDDGRPSPNRPFTFIIPSGQQKPLTTGADGNFPLQGMRVGDSYKVIDGPSGRQFEFTVAADRTRYQFDVTRRSIVTFHATDDGVPVMGETITGTYRGEPFSVTTGPDGSAEMNVVVADGEIVSATLRDRTVNAPIDDNGTHIEFTFTKEPVEPPKIVQPHILIEGDNGFIGRHYPITVQPEGSLTTPYTSDENGIVPLPPMVVGQTMTVTDGLNPGNVQQFVIEEDKEEYVFHVPYENITEPRDIRVMIRDKDDKVIPCAQVRFKQGATERLCRYDQNGDCWLAKDVFKVGEPITVSMIEPARPFLPVDFTLDPDEYEYLIKERPQFPWWMILLEILAFLAFLAAVYVLFLGACELADSARDSLYYS